ncbi:hypothetical protein D3C87_1263020 [compost metagenome]
MTSRRFDFCQIVEKRRDLLQIQMLRITQGPGPEVATKFGIGRQAIFEHFVALGKRGLYFRQLMLGQQRSPDLVAGLFQLYVKVDPGLVGDGVVVSDDLQLICRFQIVVVGIAEFFVNRGHIRGHL